MIKLELHRKHLYRAYAYSLLTLPHNLFFLNSVNQLSILTPYQRPKMTKIAGPIQLEAMKSEDRIAAMPV